MPSLRNLFKKDYGITEKVGQVGRILPISNAPLLNFDFGISEKIGDFIGKDANASTDFSLTNQSYAQPIGPTDPFQQNQSFPQSTPTGFSPSGSTSGGATGAPSNAFAAGGEVAGAQTTEPYQETQNRLNKEFETNQRLTEEQAGQIFNPLASNFGKQLDRLPSELSMLRGGVESGARSSRDLVGKQLEGSLNFLGEQEGNVRGETQKSLRNLAEDQRNTTTSMARQLGSRGAGDTSAGDYAGAAIGRQGLKQRGNALESQATGLRQIEGRRFEARNIADQENVRIEQAKQQQLNSLAQDFQNIQRQLENAKATATSDERRYIAEQQNALRQELSQRLTDLEGEVRQRKAALQDWGAQQEVQLENALRLIAGKGAYDATDVLSNIGKAGSLAANLGYQATPQGIDYLTNTLVPGAPTGLFEPKKEDEKVDQNDPAYWLNIANNLPQ